MALGQVLIPILMDYPLGGRTPRRYETLQDVLIPILMDYPLGARTGQYGRKAYPHVLIPILMDYPLGAESLDVTSPGQCLNPYSNGLPSRGPQPKLGRGF